MSAPALAVIDIGSNSIKLLVAEPRKLGGLELRVLFQEALEARISEGLGQERSQLSEKGMAAGVAAIKHLVELARPYAPAHWRVVATSAVRDAANRADFIARVQAVTGTPLEILSGDDEARLIARGIQTDPSLGGAREFCIADLGGGSLECVRYEKAAIAQAVSLQLGAVRLTEKFVARPRSPFTDAARAAVAGETLRQLTASGFQFLPGGLLVGTGGAFTVARAILAYRHGFTAKETWPAELARADLAALLDEIAPLTVEERVKIPRLTPVRADIMPAALTTILTLMDFAHVGRVVHSFHNLRFGVAARFFAEQGG
jgi:exopolyphosphatase/guanosine-5'-triphosphate,3'-diphosphate pyrophosphatase